MLAEGAADCFENFAEAADVADSAVAEEDEAGVSSLQVEDSAGVDH